MTFGEKKAGANEVRDMGRAGMQAGQFARRGTQGVPGGMVNGSRGTLGGATAGEIISKDDKGITVKLSDGGSKIVFLAESTVVTKSEVASVDDLTVGTYVMVTGTTSADGSMTAKTLRIGDEPLMLVPKDVRE